MWWPLAGLLDEEGSLSLPPASAAVTWVWHLGLINSHDASGALNTPRCHTLHPCHTPRTSYFSRCMLGYHRVPCQPHRLTAKALRLAAKPYVKVISVWERTILYVLSGKSWIHPSDYDFETPEVIPNLWAICIRKTFSQRSVDWGWDYSSSRSNYFFRVT